MPSNCFLCLSACGTVEAVRIAETNTVTMRIDRNVALDQSKFATECRDTACEERNTAVDAQNRSEDRRTELFGTR